MRLLAAALFLLVLSGPLEAQEEAQIWSTLSQSPSDAAKTAAIENVEFTKDRIHLSFLHGTIQFSQSAGQVVFGAAFEGEGRIQIDPPNPLEAQQLRRFTGQDKLDMAFSSATFSFSDDTFDRLSKQLHWAQAQQGHLWDTYEKRQRDREDVGAEILPRLFQGVLSGDRQRTGYFVADLKTSEKGWLQITYDALDPEAIHIGRYDDWGGGTGFDEWMHFPASEQSSQTAFADPIAFADYDVPQYRIDASVTTGAEFSATTRARIVEHFSGERVLRFALDSNLRVSSVKDDSGTPLTFFQARSNGTNNNSYGEYVAVVLPQPTVKGHSQTLEFLYAGKNVVRRAGNGNYFCQSSLWYPESEAPSGSRFAFRSNFEMTFHFPKQFDLVATGTKTSETSEGKTKTAIWRSDTPLTVAGFAYGEYLIVSKDVSGTKVEVYANKQPDDDLGAIQQAVDMSRSSIGSLSPSSMAEQMQVEVGNALNVFKQYYGPAPYPRLAITNIRYSYGQGWPMLIYLSAFSFLDPTQRHLLGVSSQEEELHLTDFFRAHEVSHQWWGHRVAWKSYHDQWLSEGFAQFSGNLYVQFRKGWKEYLTRLETDRTDLLSNDLRSRTFESAGPVWMGERLASADSVRAYSTVVYDKGGYVLNMLRMMLYDPLAKDPDAGFKAMMQDFTQTYDGKAASTEDFKVIAEKHMIPVMDAEGKHNLDWFFRQYVYGTGIPHYRVSTRVTDTGGGKWDVVGTAVRSEVPDNWIDILPIYLHVPGKVMRIGWVRTRDTSTPFHFVLPVKPDGISLNENDDILAIVK